jgi:hypothetical protein
MSKGVKKEGFLWQNKPGHINGREGQVTKDLRLKVLLQISENWS